MDKKSQPKLSIFPKTWEQVWAIKASAASKGMTLTEYILYLYNTVNAVKDDNPQ